MRASFGVAEAWKRADGVDGGRRRSGDFGGSKIIHGLQISGLVIGVVPYALMIKTRGKRTENTRLFTPTWPAIQRESRAIPAIGASGKLYDDVCDVKHRPGECGEGWIVGGKGAGASKRVDEYRSGSGRAGRTAGSISHGCDGSRPPGREGINGGGP